MFLYSLGKIFQIQYIVLFLGREKDTSMGLSEFL